MIDTGQSQFGDLRMSGKPDPYVALASKLVKLPALSEEDELWNDLLNDAVDSKDLDLLLDMNHAAMRRNPK